MKKIDVKNKIDDLYYDLRVNRAKNDYILSQIGYIQNMCDHQETETGWSMAGKERYTRCKICRKEW